MNSLCCALIVDCALRCVHAQVYIEQAHDAVLFEPPLNDSLPSADDDDDESIANTSLPRDTATVQVGRSATELRLLRECSGLCHQLVCPAVIVRYPLGNWTCVASAHTTLSHTQSPPQLCLLLPRRPSIVASHCVCRRTTCVA